MSAAEFAELVQARRSGAGTWQARCPAHADRSPSLSIRQGEDGRVLVHCFAGCTIAAILAALKLSIGDLYEGPPPSIAERAALRLVRERHEHSARERRKAHSAACDRMHRWEAVQDALGAKLMLSPENDALAVAFDCAQKRLREAQEEVERKTANG